jgi:hypothetical protein
MGFEEKSWKWQLRSGKETGRWERRRRRRDHDFLVPEEQARLQLMHHLIHYLLHKLIFHFRHKSIYQRVHLGLPRVLIHHHHNSSISLGRMPRIKEG